MRYAFVNPNWDFSGSTYFGCRDPHIPLELMFASDKVRETGHEAALFDAQTDELSIGQVRDAVTEFDPDFLVIPSAPSYLFWRCPPPELRVPMEWFAAIGGEATKVLIGPHASATPKSAMRKTGADVVLRGEPDQAIADLASKNWSTIDGCCWRDSVGEHITPITFSGARAGAQNSNLHAAARGLVRSATRLCSETNFVNETSMRS
jgi:hypothetical protein